MINTIYFNTANDKFSLSCWSDSDSVASVSWQLITCKCMPPSFLNIFKCPTAIRVNHHFCTIHWWNIIMITYKNKDGPDCPLGTLILLLLKLGWPFIVGHILSNMTSVISLRVSLIDIPWTTAGSCSRGTTSAAACWWFISEPVMTRTCWITSSKIVIDLGYTFFRCIRGSTC